MARDTWAAINAGSNPNKELAAHKDRPLVSDLIELNVTWLRKNRKHRSVQDAESILRRYVEPQLGKMAVADVRRRDVMEIVQRLENNGHGRTAGKVVQICRAMFNRAELDEMPWFAMREPGTNPCLRISVHLGERRTRHLSLDELRRLGQALKKAGENGENPYFIGAVLLFLLTGARLREILNAERDMVDRNNGVLELRDRKAGDPVIYLSPQALAVIDALPEMPDNPYLIPGKRPGRPMINPYKPWKRLMEAAGIDNATFHDLRRTYASRGLGSGMTLEQIGALLGHSQTQTTQGYAFLESQIARENAERIGIGIHDLLNVENPTVRVG
jgi:integrase